MMAHMPSCQNHRAVLYFYEQLRKTAKFLRWNLINMHFS